MSTFISNLGPEFFVGKGKKRWAFQRAVDGPEEGSVEITLWIDGEIHHCTTVDAAGWASVLAHLSAAEHNGDTYQVGYGLSRGPDRSRRDPLRQDWTLTVGYFLTWIGGPKA